MLGHKARRRACRGKDKEKEAGPAEPAAAEPAAAEPAAATGVGSTETSPLQPSEPRGNELPRVGSQDAQGPDFGIQLVQQFVCRLHIFITVALVLC